METTKVEPKVEYKAEDFAKAYPHMQYRPDHVRTDHFDGSREIYAFFDALIDDKNANVLEELKAFYAQHPDATPEQVIEFIGDKRNGLIQEHYSNRYLSEDYMFCQWYRKIGGHIWLCPWVQTQHVGTYAFTGNMAKIADLTGKL